MREEAISSTAGDASAAVTAAGNRSSSPPPTPTPAASSVGASSPAVATNAASIDWLGHGQGSKAGSLSRIGSLQMGTSMSTSAVGSVGPSQLSCRPWDRGDLLRRLSTFKPSSWSGKPKTASSLACARRGWVSVEGDRIECESCGEQLCYSKSAMWLPTDDAGGKDFAEQLDGAHLVSCPWKGNSCAESLVQFPPAPPSALIGGYKDRWDGLLQFFCLPIVAASTLELIRASRGRELDRFLVQSHAFMVGESGFKPDIASGSDNTKDEAFYVYSHAQKLISLCGWEPRWLPNIQDCEENSAQSARNGFSAGPSKGRGRLPERGRKKKAMSTSTKIGSGNNDQVGPSSKCESRSPLLDCSLCGATVRILDFLTVDRPPRFAPNNIDVPESSKKIAVTRGVSAASGISGWIATDGMFKEQAEDFDEAATTGEAKSLSNMGLDLNLSMGGGLPSSQFHRNVNSERYQDTNIGRDLVIGQPSSSEVGDRAASYESRGPSTRKRNLEEGGSTIDRPLAMVPQADSVEGGIVIDRDGDEVNDGSQYSAGPSKRSRDSQAFEMYQSSYRGDSSRAGPSQTMFFDIDQDIPSYQGYEQGVAITSTRDSARASSVIAMEKFCHSSDDDSMESVENFPGGFNDFNYPSTSTHKNPDLNETSEMDLSNQAQQSVCPAVVRVAGEIGVSSTNCGEEVLNTETATVHGKDGPSFGISGGSVGMGASHEAEIHGIGAHRAESGDGDVELVAEVTENQGQTGEFGPDPGLMGDFVPEEIDGEYPHGESLDITSRSVGKADSGSKIVGSTKAESVESGEKTSNMNILPHDHSNHPSLSCNAVLCSGPEASKEEVTQKSYPTDECAYPDLGYLVANGTGPPNGGSNFEEVVEFDPIKHHNFFCPWVNGNVAAAGCSSRNGSSSNDVALCGWQLTLDALDAFQSLPPNQTAESESAASLKDDRHLPDRKLKSRHSFSQTRGQN